MYQNKMQEKGVQEVMNLSKIKFGSYGHLVDLDSSQDNEKLIDNAFP